MNSGKEFQDIRTAVIGAGSMGQNHARIYNDISNLVAIADIDDIQGKKIAERFGIKWFSDYRDMLGEVDAVTVAVPTSIHRRVVEKVVREGVNVLVEKPLAGNSLDAEAIVEASETSGVTLAVGHVERHNEIVMKAKKSIKNREWGDVLTLSARRFSNYPLRIHDVGVLFDLTIHDVDVICSLVDSNVKTVYAVGGKSRNEKHEDYVSLAIEFEDGLTGICQTNWLTPMKVRELDITTTSGFIRLNYLKQEIDISSSTFSEIDEKNLFQPPMEVSERKLSFKGKEPLKSELIDFLDAIMRKRKPLVTGNDGLTAVKIVEAGLRSLESNSVIKF